MNHIDVAYSQVLSGMFKLAAAFGLMVLYGFYLRAVISRR